MTKAERMADAATGVSTVGWIVSICAQALPVIQAIAGLLAIVSALFAIRYYHKRSR